MLSAAICLAAGPGSAQLKNKALPPVIRAVYLPSNVLTPDDSATDSFVTDLRDAGVNLLITEEDEPTSYAGHLWRAIRSADEMLSNTKAFSGVFVNLTTTATLLNDTHTSRPTAILDPNVKAGQKTGKFQAGIAASAEDLDRWTTTGGFLEKLPQIVMLAPDLSTLDAATSESVNDAEDWLNDMARRSPRRRVAPWVRAEDAASPDDLENAIRGSIELTGGVVVEVSTATLVADSMGAIRRGMQANYLLPEG